MKAHIDKQRTFIQLRFDDFTSKEEIESLLFLYEPLGIHEEDDAWFCYFDEREWLARIAPELLPRLRAALPDIRFQFLEVRQHNWNEEWERSVTPIRVSDRFVISPTWHHVEVPAQTILLTIDPKMSFGTGYHPTTRLMLRLLESSVCGGERMLDVGTGTGVLAVAAVKLGAHSAMGVDTDEWSYDNAIENLERNGVLDRVEIRHGSLEQAVGRFDIIAANITRNDNIGMLEQYRSLLNENGILVLSGFYETDIPDLRHAAALHGFEEIARLSEELWSAISFRLVRS